MTNSEVTNAAVRRRGWKEFALYALLAALAIAPLVYLRVRTKPTPRAEDVDHRQYERADPLLVDHLRKNVIQPLEAESLDESLERLHDVELYIQSGVIPSAMIRYVLPLPEKIGETDVHMIASNRRFLKVFSELSKLPAAEAAGKINESIAKALPLYHEAMRIDLKGKEASNRPGVVPDTVGVYQCSNNPDGTPTLLGLRYKLLSLALIAGNLKLTGCRGAVADVAKAAREQREEFGDIKRYNIYAGYSILAGASLYNRQILALAVIGTHHDQPDASGGRAKLEQKATSLTLTSFRSVATTYDPYVQLGIVPVDKALGSLSLRYCVGVTDEEIRAVLRPVL